MVGVPVLEILLHIHLPGIEHTGDGMGASAGHTPPHPYTWHGADWRWHGRKCSTTIYLAFSTLEMVGVPVLVILLYDHLPGMEHTGDGRGTSAGHTHPHPYTWHGADWRWHGSKCCSYSSTTIYLAGSTLEMVGVPVLVILLHIHCNQNPEEISIIYTGS